MHHNSLNGNHLNGMQKSTALQRNVLKWFSANGRDFPWRRTTNSFYLFIAEVLLRQTQAERVVKPYLELTNKYPSAVAMSEADLKELRKWFEPLGLSKRADRLIQAAKIVVEKYSGQIPNSLEAIQALPGMGIYSARAVLCLAFGTRVPMIDEGSGRVFRRVLGLTTHGPAYSDSKLRKAVEGLLPRSFFREFNLGLLDIAATYCHVKKPNCSVCPVISTCQYRRSKLRRFARDKKEDANGTT